MSSRLPVVFDFSEFKKYAKQFEKLKQKDIDAFYIKAIKAMAARYLMVAIANTPVDTGYLKGAWTGGAKVDPFTYAMNAIKVTKQGQFFQVEIENTAPYATFVFYGHRTTNGGFVQGWNACLLAEKDLARKGISIAEPILLKMFKDYGFDV